MTEKGRRETRERGGRDTRVMEGGVVNTNNTLHVLSVFRGEEWTARVPNTRTMPIRACFLCSVGGEWRGGKNVT